MPRRLVLLALGLLLLLPAAASARATTRIVGGSTTSISSVPWQVAVLVNDGTGTFLCGGSIRDASTVVTAAHCTLDPDTDAPFAVSDYQIDAGTTDLASPPTVRGVTAVTRHPSYTPSSSAYDVALLQLSAPLTLGATQAAIAPAAATPDVGAPLTVSGWGTTMPVSADAPPNADPASDTLRAATVNLVADGASTCGPAYLPDYVDALMLCAAAANTDSCQGDSGGPLVSQTSPPVLVGIVSFGAGCADPRYAGVYTEVAAPAVHNFILGSLVVPSPTTSPTLTGTPRAGERITCNPGTWTNAASFAYEFFTNPGGGLVILRGFSADPGYTLTDGDVNRTVGCVVRATSPDGAIETAVANTLGPVASRVVAPPVTTTTTERTTPTDTVRPESTVIARSCTRTTCRVVVSVDDAGFSAGVARVAVTYTTRDRVACRRGGRRTTCARTRRGTATAVGIGVGRYVTKLRRLPAGSSTTLRFLAYDKAGNRERYATTVTVRTTKAKRR
jgi:secreted trypsin-like serine protease